MGVLLAAAEVAAAAAAAGVASGGTEMAAVSVAPSTVDGCVPWLLPDCTALPEGGVCLERAKRDIALPVPPLSPPIISTISFCITS